MSLHFFFFVLTAVSLMLLSLPLLFSFRPWKINYWIVQRVSEVICLHFHLMFINSCESEMNLVLEFQLATRFFLTCIRFLGIAAVGCCASAAILLNQIKNLNNIRSYSKVIRTHHSFKTNVDTIFLTVSGVIILLSCSQMFATNKELCVAELCSIIVI